MNTSIWFCRTAQGVLVIGIAAWLSCGASGFAGDAAPPSSSNPQATESDTLGTVWKQLMATRQELAQLRREANEQARGQSTMQKLQRQLAETSATLATCLRQYESVEPEKKRLQQQVTSLQKRVASVPALEADVQRLRTEISRLAKSLADAQAEQDVLVRTKQLMMEKQVETQLARDAAMRILEKQMKARKQEKETLSKALAGAEGNTRRKLAAQKNGFVAKEKALAKMELQIQEFKAAGKISAARAAEIEQQRAQEQEKADAAAKELKKNLKAEQARAAALEKEKVKASKKVRKLEKALEKEKARTKTQADKQVQQLKAVNEKSAARAAEFERQRAQEKEQTEELQQLRKKIADALEQAKKDGS